LTIGGPDARDDLGAVIPSQSTARMTCVIAGFTSSAPVFTGISGQSPSVTRASAMRTAVTAASVTSRR
jgi:hypothetical protein